METSKNILNGTRCYLVGAIENAADGGTGWRDFVKERLDPMGIKVFDPCDKPFVKDLSETTEMQQLVKQLRRDGDYDRLAKVMKEIRIYDLKLVDISDFIFCYLDATVLSCGSWEELFVANRSKKPCFFVYRQGISQVPSWMFGTLPHKYFYGSLTEAIETIQNIDNGTKEIDNERWKLLRPEFR